MSIPFRETSPPVEEPHGSTLVFFEGALRLARKDFGVLGGSTYNDWFDAVRAAVARALELDPFEPRALEMRRRLQ